MKKVMLVLLVILCISFCAVGCVQIQSEDVKIYLPDGAPALSLAYMMENYTELNGRSIDYTVVPSNTIASYVANGTADMAIVPTNAAVTLFNAGKDISLVSVNTFGNLYMVSKTEIGSLDELNGKVVAVIGQAQTPDLVLRSVLEASEIEVVEGDTATEGKVTILYADDGGAAIGYLVAGKAEVALLGEPAVTNAMNKTGATIVIDLQEEWRKATGYDGFPQASLIASNSLNRSFIEAFLSALEKGNGYVVDNNERAVELIALNMLEGTEPSIKTLSKNTALRCNVGMMRAEVAQASIERYIEVLGLEIKGEGFYFGV